MWSKVLAASGAACILASSAQATVLTFDVDVTRPLASLPFDPSYGDRVTALQHGVAAYGVGAEGFTPNVTVGYTDGEGATNFIRWSDGYGDLVNVIYSNTSRPLVRLQFTADPGYGLALYGFDLAGWPNRDYTVPGVAVTSGSDTLFSQTDVLVRGASGTPRHTSFDFADGLLGGEALTILFDLGGPGSFGNIGIDNVRFGQFALAPPPVGGVPEPATWAMMIMGFAGVGGLLRKAVRARVGERKRRLRGLVLGASGLIASLVVTPAAAADVRFTLTNDATPGSVSWLLPLSPTPGIFGADAYFGLEGPIHGTFEGTEAGDGQVEFEVFAFLADAAGGGFATFAFIALAAPGPPDFSIPYGAELSGPQLFTGPTDAPTFRLGTFALTDACSSFCGPDTGNFTLTISAAAVPEPATWATMILGFGAVGALVRARTSAAGRRIRA
jgi:hypothetical protein